MTRRELIFDLNDDDDNVSDEDQPSTSGQNDSTAKKPSVDVDYEPLESAPESDQSYEPSTSRQKSPKKRRKLEKASPAVKQIPSSKNKGSKNAPAKGPANLSGKNSLPISKQSPKILSIDDGFSNLDRFDFKNNAFVEKQPRLQFNADSQIGQVVQKYSASLTAGEIRLALRRMDEDQVLLSLAENIDEVLEENEQLLQTIDEMSNKYTTLERRYIKLQEKFEALLRRQNSSQEVSPEPSQPKKLRRQNSSQEVSPEPSQPKKRGRSKKEAISSKKKSAGKRRRIAEDESDVDPAEPNLDENEKTPDQSEVLDESEVPAKITIPNDNFVVIDYVPGQQNDEYMTLGKEEPTQNNAPNAEEIVIEEEVILDDEDPAPNETVIDDKHNDHDYF